MQRQSAVCSFAEILGFDSECVIETRAVVLPRDAGSELYKFHLVELLSHPRKHGVRYFHRSLAHAVGIFQNEPIQIRKVQIRAIVVQISDLFGRDSDFPADGRADIDSKRTPNQSCNS
jgi:hypothetical protein